MELPLILAGPILRRVDPSTVAVWMAFSEPADLELRVWEGRVAHDTTNPVFVSSDDPPDPSAPPPRPGAEADPDRRAPPSRAGDGPDPTGVGQGLPARPPLLLRRRDQRRGRGARVGRAWAARHPHRQRRPRCRRSDTTTGCCRASPCPRPSSTICGSRTARAGGPATTTATRSPGSTICSSRTVGDPRARIHQLFLGGDQIYADDVDSVMMLRVVELGVELIGTRRRHRPADRAGQGREGAATAGRDRA